MGLNLQIIPSSLLEHYLTDLDDSLQSNFEHLQDSDLSMDSFSFYTSVSAVFSSKIEGESIDLDSFIKHKRFGVHYQPDYIRKIDDLYEAYLFAQQNRLEQGSLEQAHSLLTKHILHKTKQGKMREGNMFVITKDGKIEYVAASPDKVESEMTRLYLDIEILLKSDLSFGETLFYSAMLHLVFVKIHPFEDGNGRTARLLEKWFLAQKLGSKAWFVQSERNYYEQHTLYYENIRHLGLEYDVLDYSQALPFLKMLSSCLDRRMD